MSADSTALERPPSYEAPDSTWPPTIFVLAGQSIHADTAESAPLYKLNRGIASLTHATSEVELQRVERAVRAEGATGDHSEPTVKTRPPHIYTLKHMNRAPGGLEGLPSDSPPYYIQAASRHAVVGDVGLKKERFRSSRWTALPVDVTGRHSSRGLPQFVKDAPPLFKIRKEDDGRHKWTDAEGKEIAVEDEGEDQHRLLVGVSLSREMGDALVSLWCCRLWKNSAEHAEGLHEGMDGVRRKFRLAKELPAHGSTWLTPKKS